MNPPIGVRFPGTWGRLIHALRVYRPVAWLVFLSASLALFLAWMSSQMRMIIWYGRVARGIRSGMLLVFSFLAFCDAFETLRHNT